MIKSQLEEPFESAQGDNNPDNSNLSPRYGLIGFSYTPSHRDGKSANSFKKRLALLHIVSISLSIINNIFYTHTIRIIISSFV